MIRLLLILAVISTSGSYARQADTTESKRTCRVFFLERSADAPGEAFLFDGTHSQKVALSSMNLSRIIELPPGEITLGLTPNEVLDPETFPEGVPRATIPEAYTDFYLIMTSDPTNRIIPIRMHAIQIDGKLKSGETLWINLTQHNILAKLGNQTLMIPHKKQKICPAPLSESGYYSANFSYQRNATGKFLPIMNKSWWLDHQSKHLGFIVGTDARLPKIFTIRDRRISAPPIGEPELTGYENDE
jgi:hypothetical protein